MDLSMDWLWGILKDSLDIKLRVVFWSSLNAHIKGFEAGAQI